MCDFFSLEWPGKDRFLDNWPECHQLQRSHVGGFDSPEGLEICSARAGLLERLQPGDSDEPRRPGGARRGRGRASSGETGGRAPRGWVELAPPAWRAVRATQSARRSTPGGPTINTRRPPTAPGLARPHSGKEAPDPPGPAWLLALLRQLRRLGARLTPRGPSPRAPRASKSGDSAAATQEPLSCARRPSAAA